MNRGDLLLNDSGTVGKVGALIRHLRVFVTFYLNSLHKHVIQRNRAVKMKMNHFSHSTGTLCADQTTHLHEKGKGKNTGVIKTET